MNDAKRLGLTLLLTGILLVLSACGVEIRTDVPIVMTREPAATPVPGPVTEGVKDLTEATGLDDEAFLGVAISDWANVLASVLLVLALYFLAIWLLRKSFHWLARLTSDVFAATARARLERPLRWLILLVLLHFGVARLGFINVFLWRALLDILFTAALILSTLIAWRVLDLSADYYRSRQTDPQRLVEVDPAVTLIVRLGRAVLIVIAFSIFLSHFGINVAALTAALGISGLVLSLAAKDTVADAIAGVIILFDRPFRVGDRIEIQELGTWGDVVDIGLRTTRIRTRDNRMVIVPNSTINSNQIVNYSYPDPRYRVETRVGIAYGSDVEQVRSVMEAAVRGVEGVLPDKPVDVLYDEMGDYAMMFRVRWWIQSYEDTRRMDDRVNTALQAALDAHGIRSPYPTQVVRLENEPQPPAASETSQPD